MPTKSTSVWQNVVVIALIIAWVGAFGWNKWNQWQFCESLAGMSIEERRTSMNLPGNRIIFLSEYGFLVDYDCYALREL